MHDAHVQAYYQHYECWACARIGGYCGDSCNGAYNWFQRLDYRD